MDDGSLDSLKSILDYHDSLRSKLKPNLDLIKPTIEITNPIRNMIEVNNITNSFKDIIEPSLNINELTRTNLKSALNIVDTIPKFKYNFPTVDFVSSIPKINYDIYVPKIDYSSVFDSLPKLDFSYITDFRISVLNQSIFQKQQLLFEQINNASEPIIDELNIEFDELISETFADTTNQNNQESDIADIKSMIFQVYKSQEDLKEAVQEKFKNHENKSPVEKSSNNIFNNLHTLAISIFTVLSLVPVPKEVYESLVWYAEFLTYLINFLINN